MTTQQTATQTAPTATLDPRFVCGTCGADTHSAPGELQLAADPKAKAICPKCCATAEHANGETGHEYIYDRHEGHYCAHCGELASDEWHRDRAADMAERDAEREYEERAR